MGGPAQMPVAATPLRCPPRTLQKPADDDEDLDLWCTDLDWDSNETCSLNTEHSDQDAPSDCSTQDVPSDETSADGGEALGKRKSESKLSSMFTVASDALSTFALNLRGSKSTDQLTRVPSEPFVTESEADFSSELDDMVSPLRSSPSQPKKSQHQLTQELLVSRHTGLDSPLVNMEIQRMLQDFYQLGQQGRPMEAIRSDGQAVPFVFYLNKKGDAFQMSSSQSRAAAAGSPLLYFRQIKHIHLGDSDYAQVVKAHYPGLILDQRALVLELRQGPTIIMRFRGNSHLSGFRTGAEEAKTFARCSRMMAHSGFEPVMEFLKKFRHPKAKE